MNTMTSASMRLLATTRWLLSVSAQNRHGLSYHKVQSLSGYGQVHSCSGPASTTYASALTRFLEDGDKAKVSLRFRGREMAHQHLGMELVNRIRKDLEEFGTVEQEPKMEGRQIVMVLAPVKKRPQ